MKLIACMFSVPLFDCFLLRHKTITLTRASVVTMATLPSVAPTITPCSVNITHMHYEDWHIKAIDIMLSIVTGIIAFELHWL